MTRSLATFVLICVIACLTACSGPQSTPAPESLVDDAFDALKEAFGELETASEKASTAEEFLTRFPESEYSGTIADVIVYYRGEELGEKDKAWQVVSGALEKVTDPEVRFEISMKLMPLSNDLGKGLDLAAIVDDLTAHRELTFDDRIEVMDLAVDMELWKVAAQHSIKGLKMVTPAVLKAENPDEELTDDEIAKEIRRRKALILTVQGWMLANTNRSEKAQAVFEQAALRTDRNYLGVPDTRVNLYWGQTMLQLGDAERALDLLAPDAVMGDSDEAMEAFKEAWALKNGSADGFEAFLESTRSRLARVVDTFQLPDYQGNLVDFGSFRGKVTFLTFWFPT